MSVKNVFIRGSVVRYIQIPASEVDVQVSETNTSSASVNQALHQLIDASVRAGVQLISGGSQSQ